MGVKLSNKKTETPQSPQSQKPSINNTQPVPVNEEEKKVEPVNSTDEEKEKEDSVFRKNSSFYNALIDNAKRKSEKNNYPKSKSEKGR